MRRAEAGIQVDKFYPPTDWLDNNNKQIDIRKNAENNSIVLLVGHSADFSKYSLLGLLADTSSGTYDVYIDDVLVGSGVTKNTQYDIDFSTIATSYGTATTPEALVLHKVVIKPTTSGEKITTFHCAKTSGVSTNQVQGVLWVHLELSNTINITHIIAPNSPYNYRSHIFRGFTAKGNYIDNANVSIGGFINVTKVTFIPKIKNLICNGQSFYNVDTIKRIVCDNFSVTSSGATYIFNLTKKLEQISINSKNRPILINSSQFDDAQSLKVFPFSKNDFSGNNGTNFLRNNMSLYPIKLDLSSLTNLMILRVNGASGYQMRGLRGLKVSNEAPFSNSSSPQINVSYTGLDRDALVELFISLPTVTGGQTLSLVGATGNNLTKIGSPTIDENGVASGFSSGNYFRINGFPKVSADWEIKIKAKPQNNTSYAILMGSWADSSCYITFRKNELSSEFGNGRIIKSGNFDATIFYFIKATKKGTKISLYYSTDDINYILCGEKEGTLSGGNADLMFGNGNANWGRAYPYENEIDLEGISIKTNRNYLMKGYITDADKNIALNKGWSLTLS